MLRMLRRWLAAGEPGGAHLLVRVHVLRGVRRGRARRALSELRRRTAAAAGAAGGEAGEVPRVDRAQGEGGRMRGRMNAEQLRAAQAPLKQRYRDYPASARILAQAEAVLSADDVACTIVGRTGPLVAGLHPAAGG